VAPATALATEGLRLENVAFRYAQAHRPTLQGLSLHLPATGLVAVLGNSGAGKSSLLKVLAGLMAPQEGRYQFAGQLISSDADRDWLRHHLAYKSQDPHCLPGTVRQIVTDWADNVDDEPVVAALRLAGLGPQLERNELGLNTAVGTNGDGLSGGQRQMLALAAAFYSPAPVLLLDEPTLGLDRAAQASLMAGLVELSKQRLVCVSTHATELIRLTQRVLVLDQGRIVLDGPPALLLEAKPGAAKAARPTPQSQTPPSPPKAVVHEPKEILQ
jgi:ABC-type bacteriocin/lantibiotic exporter with double-glycine peptidase domain